MCSFWAGGISSFYRLLRRLDKMQQVVVVSPLVQIMQEQVKDLASHGMKAARIGESSDVDHQVIEGVLLY
jgi:superfamily II DNA helicase RecQ